MVPNKYLDTTRVHNDKIFKLSNDHIHEYKGKLEMRVNRRKHDVGVLTKELLYQLPIIINFKTSYLIQFQIMFFNSKV